MAATRECRGCLTSVRLNHEAIQRVLDRCKADTPELLLDEAGVQARMELCRKCPELDYGTTCRHCGCLVLIRTSRRDKHCPAPGAPRW